MLCLPLRLQEWSSGRSAYLAELWGTSLQWCPRPSANALRLLERFKRISKLDKEASHRRVWGFGVWLYTPLSYHAPAGHFGHTLAWSIHDFVDTSKTSASGRNRTQFGAIKMPPNPSMQRTPKSGRWSRTLPVGERSPYGQTTHAAPPSIWSNGCPLPLTIDEIVGAETQKPNPVRSQALIQQHRLISSSISIDFPITRSFWISWLSIGQHSVSNEILRVSVPIPRCSWGGEPSLLPTCLFLSINQAVGSMAVGQSEARTDMALKLLYLEPRTERGRGRNKEDVIMDWASLLMIEMVVGFLGIFALHLFWKDQKWGPALILFCSPQYPIEHSYSWGETMVFSLIEGFGYWGSQLLGFNGFDEIIHNPML